MRFFALFLIPVLSSSPAFAIGRYALENIIEKLDVTSFPTSISIKKEKIHFSDYGYEAPEIRGNRAVLKGKQGEFRITLLHRTLQDATVCIEEIKKDGALHTQSPFFLVPNADKTIFKAQDKKIEDSKCPRFNK